MVGIAEAFALFFSGLLAGVLTTLCDIVAFGTDSFVAHFSLWVLYTALIAIHVDSRRKAVWWSIPFTLGYVELYYLCTAASFEGYAKSTVVPLAALAVAAPLLSYALWTAKRDRGAYGKVLSVFIAAGVVGAEYLIFDTYYHIFTNVVAAVLLFVLLFWPARRLKFTPSEHPAPEIAEEPVERPSARQATSSSSRRSSARREANTGGLVDAREADELGDVPAYGEYDEYMDDLSYVPAESPLQRRGTARQSRRVDDGADTVRRQRLQAERDEYEDEERVDERRRPARRSGKRSSSGAASGSAMTRRSPRERETERSREAQRRAAARRRARRERAGRSAERGQERDVDPYYTSTVSTLGTSRTARPSTRGARRDYRQ